jgi:hypothetical protein
VANFTQKDWQVFDLLLGQMLSFGNLFD